MPPFHQVSFADAKEVPLSGMKCLTLISISLFLLVDMLSYSKQASYDRKANTTSFVFGSLTEYFLSDRLGADCVGQNLNVLPSINLDHSRRHPKV